MSHQSNGLSIFVHHMSFRWRREASLSACKSLIEAFEESVFTNASLEQRLSKKSQLFVFRAKAGDAALQSRPSQSHFNWLELQRALKRFCPDCLGDKVEEGDKVLVLCNTKGLFQMGKAKARNKTGDVNVSYAHCSRNELNANKLLVRLRGLPISVRGSTR